jgi:hypothetical protein
MLCTKIKFFEGLVETNMFKQIIGLCDHYKIGWLIPKVNVSSSSVLYLPLSSSIQTSLIPQPNKKKFKVWTKLFI